MAEYLRLRQICLVARDLEAVTAQICKTFGVEVCMRSPGVNRHGLNNTVTPFGPTFMEVVANQPDKALEDTTAGRYLLRIGGDGGYMVILDSDDALRWRPHFEKVGVRIAQDLDRPTYRAAQMHPKDVGGTLMSIGHDVGGDDLLGDWHAAGKDWKKFMHTERVAAIAGVTMQSDDPKRLAARWAEIWKKPVHDDASGLHVHTDNCKFYFVADKNGRGETMAGLDIKVNDKAAVLKGAREAGVPMDGETLRICGLDWRLI